METPPKLTYGHYTMAVFVIQEKCQIDVCRAVARNAECKINECRIEVFPAEMIEIVGGADTIILHFAFIILHSAAQAAR